MVVVLGEVRRPVVGGILGGPSGSGAPLLGRVRVLEAIAERYAELVDPLVRSGVSGDGLVAGVLSMPSTYTVSVREFERLVGRLRVERRELWWHLDGWWLSAESRTRFQCPRCGPCHQSEHLHSSRRNGGRLVAVRCKRVVVWSRRVGAREGVAREALVVLAGWWGLVGEPMLPDEYRLVA